MYPVQVIRMLTEKSYVTQYMELFSPHSIENIFECFKLQLWLHLTNGTLMHYP